MSARRGGAGGTVALFDVDVRNAAKVWWPDEGLTKLDVARHYATLEPRLRPWLEDRPLTAERCPDGLAGRCFYQKNFPEARRLGLRTVAVRAETVRRTVHYVLGGGRRTLVTLVNLGCLTIHVMNARADALDRPDWLAFDLDPAAGFAQAVQAATLLRAVLEACSLRGYPKTSGGKGLHVLVPLVRGPDQEAVRAFARAVGDTMTARAPDLVTTVFGKAGRRGRLYVDVMRNARGQTIVPPYAVRHRPRAPVSTPLAWDEVHARLDPAAFTLRTIERRLAGPDPWADLWRDRQRLPGAPDPGRLETSRLPDAGSRTPGPGSGSALKTPVRGSEAGGTP